MGTCSRGGSIGLVRKPVAGAHLSGRLRSDLERHASANILVNTAVGWVVATNPAVATVYTAYKVGTAAVGIAKAYQKSERAGSQRVRSEARATIREVIIERVSDAVVPSGLPPPASNLAKSLVSSVVSQVLPQ